MINCLVTVVIPIYNVEKHLNRCIESVVNQTYKDLEIILVDDKSPDNSPQICDQWAKKDSRIKVVHKDNNAGLGMARNTGIDNANGDYICFFDSDDYVEKDTIEKAVTLATKENADVVSFGFIRENSSQNIVEHEVPQPYKNVYQGTEVQDILLAEKIAPDPKTGKDSNLGISSCTGLFSLEILKKNNIRFHSEREIICEDLYFTLDLYKYVNKVAILTESFYHYCFNEASLTHTYASDRTEKIDYCFSECVKLSKKNNYPKSVLIALKHGYLCSVIGGFKTIVQSNSTNKAKKAEIKNVVKSSLCQEFIKDIPAYNYSKAKLILIKMMQLKLSSLVYLMVKFKG